MRNGTPAKDDGVGSMVMITTALRSRCRRRKILACRTYTPGDHAIVGWAARAPWTERRLSYRLCPPTDPPLVDPTTWVESKIMLASDPHPPCRDEHLTHVIARSYKWMQQLIAGEIVSLKALEFELA
jgi:hypothetical protein